MGNQYHHPSVHNISPYPDLAGIRKSIFHLGLLQCSTLMRCAKLVCSVKTANFLNRCPPEIPLDVMYIHDPYTKITLRASRSTLTGMLRSYIHLVAVGKCNVLNSITKFISVR